MVERGPEEAGVGGSIPSRGTNNPALVAGLCRARGARQLLGARSGIERRSLCPRVRGHARRWLDRVRRRADESRDQFPPAAQITPPLWRGYAVRGERANCPTTSANEMSLKLARIPLYIPNKAIPKLVSRKYGIAPFNLALRARDMGGYLARDRESKTVLLLYSPSPIFSAIASISAAFLTNDFTICSPMKKRIIIPRIISSIFWKIFSDLR